MNDFQKDMDKYKDKLSKLIQSENNKSKYNPELDLLSSILKTIETEFDKRDKAEKQNTIRTIISLILASVSAIASIFAIFL